MTCRFAIDKKESLAIIQSIIDSTPVYDKDGWKCHLYKHHLGVTELYLENENIDKETSKIEDHYEEVIETSNKNEYADIEDEGFELKSIEIGKEDDGKEVIHMETYLNIAECDWSYPSFSYDKKLQSWIIRDDGWSAPYGIGIDCSVTFLNFNYYKQNKANQKLNNRES